MRERSPGVWEIRIVTGFDEVTRRSVQRSFTVHGDAAAADKSRRDLVDQHGVTRVAWSTAGSRMTVGELLQRYVDAPHLWKPATYVSHRSVVQQLLVDPIATEPVVTLTAGVVLGAVGRWQTVGASVPTVSGRWLLLHSALSWAVREQLLRSSPLTGVRGPPRPAPRRHHSIDEVRAMLRTAEQAVADAEDAFAADSSGIRRRLLFSNEQTLLLVRIAADSGARRGELAVFRRSDLDGRVLTIERGLSHGVLGATKSGRTRRLTLGSTTTSMIDSHFTRWEALCPDPVSDWIFAPTPRRVTFVSCDALSHKFRRLGRAAGVEQAALHRLRHGVATYLVNQGKLLSAQARLGHRDPATTLRHYSHAVSLGDTYVADNLDELLNSRDHAFSR